MRSKQPALVALLTRWPVFLAYVEQVLAPMYQKHLEFRLPSLGQCRGTTT